MNSLLIYSNNIASTTIFNFNNQLGDSYLFQIGQQDLLSGSFNLDEKIDEILKYKLEIKKYDAIFIPYSLSETNYLEFIGLRFACHIRLTKEFNNLQTPIIFYGYEQAEELNKLSDLGSIIFTKNIFHTSKISINDFAKQLEYIKSNVLEVNEDEFILSFLSKVNIKTGGNYATHHSIANEWSIYRWAKALGVVDTEIGKIEDKIGFDLYFKYLKCRFPIINNFINPELDLNAYGNVLYIDDEVQKGWGTIFHHICKKLKFEPFGNQFKSATAEEVVSLGLKKVIDFKPDVVILDFRLHDDDFEISNPELVTGFKLLKQIKLYNEGIQVVIFSATNKIWNLIALQKAGADGFIIKESPENSVDSEFTNQAISNIYLTIDTSLRNGFLKSVYEKIQVIKKMYDENINSIEGEFVNRMKNNLDIAFALLKESNNINKYYNYAFLQIFQIIEDFIDLNSVFREGSDSYVVMNEKEIVVQKNTRGTLNWPISLTHAGKYEIKSKTSKIEINSQIKRLDTNFKVSAVLIYRYGNDNSSVLKWTEIYKLRNQGVAHFNKNLLVNSDNIDVILEFLKYFINPANQNETNIDKGLPMKTLNESLEALEKQGKFITKKGNK